MSANSEFLSRIHAGDVWIHSDYGKVKIDYVAKTQDGAVEFGFTPLQPSVRKVGVEQAPAFASRIVRKHVPDKRVKREAVAFDPKAFV